MIIQYPEPRIPTKAARTEDSICRADMNMNFEHSHRLVCGITWVWGVQAHSPHSSCHSPRGQSTHSSRHCEAQWTLQLEWVPGNGAKIPHCSFCLHREAEIIQYSNCIHLCCFLAVSCRGHSALLLFNTVGISLLTSPAPGHVYFYCHGGNIVLKYRKKLLGCCYI